MKNKRKPSSDDEMIERGTHVGARASRSDCFFLFKYLFSDVRV